MLNDKDRVAILEMWSQFRPDMTEEDAYPQILRLVEAAIVLKLSKPPSETRVSPRLAAAMGGTNGG